MKFLILLLFTYLDKGYAEATRDGKVLPVFQVVRFPNDPCVVSGGTKNGTCYTVEECSNKGGTNGGTCASGFGVCCTFSVGCGASSSENCTYFEVTNAPLGACTAKVCKCSSDICQMRLDFTSFIITGPSTNTVSEVKVLGGGLATGGKNSAYRGTCFTDTFTVSNSDSVPELCGTLTGEHVYFDADEECHDLSFSIGQNAIGTTALTSRSFNVKVTQIDCNSNQLAPEGCLQYHTGTSGTGIIKTFNYDNSVHLANQYQQICFRAEAGNCRQCFSADTITDVQLGGKNDKGMIKHSYCCAYGEDGNKDTASPDCIIIPGAEKAAATAAMVADCQGGGMGGLVTANNGIANAANSKTICTKDQPFRIAFQSDPWENVAVGDKTTTGFKLRYWQMVC